MDYVCDISTMEPLGCNLISYKQTDNQFKAINIELISFYKFWFIHFFHLNVRFGCHCF